MSITDLEMKAFNEQVKREKNMLRNMTMEEKINMFMKIAESNYKNTHTNDTISSLLNEPHNDQPHDIPISAGSYIEPPLPNIPENELQDLHRNNESAD
jgi:glutaminase